jgi:hypothetical protein
MAGAHCGKRGRGKDGCSIRARVSPELRGPRSSSETLACHGDGGEVCGGESRSCCRKKKTFAPLDYKWTVSERTLIFRCQKGSNSLIFKEHFY